MKANTHTIEVTHYYVNFLRNNTRGKGVYEIVPIIQNGSDLYAYPRLQVLCDYNRFTTWSDHKIVKEHCMMTYRMSGKRFLLTNIDKIEEGGAV